MCARGRFMGAGREGEYSSLSFSHRNEDPFPPTLPQQWKKKRHISKHILPPETGKRKDRFPLWHYCTAPYVGGGKRKQNVEKYGSGRVRGVGGGNLNVRSPPPFFFLLSSARPHVSFGNTQQRPRKEGETLPISPIFTAKEEEGKKREELFSPFFCWERTCDVTSCLCPLSIHCFPHRDLEMKTDDLRRAKEKGNKDRKNHLPAIR